MKNAMFRSPKPAWAPFVWLLVIVASVNCGCSGINASKSISPLDFLLPGLHIQNDPPQPVFPASTNVLACWDGGVSALANR